MQELAKCPPAPPPQQRLERTGPVCACVYRALDGGLLGHQNTPSSRTVRATRALLPALGSLGWDRGSGCLHALSLPL